MTGICTHCKDSYQTANAVPYPGNEAEILCRRCGSGLFRRRIRRSLWFAICGSLFGWSLASVRWHALIPQATVVLIGAYVSWSTFWGWHVGTLKWEELYQTLKKRLRITLLCVALLLFIRVFAALLIGATGHGIKQNLQMLYVLRRINSWHLFFCWCFLRPVHKRPCLSCRVQE